MTLDRLAKQSVFVDIRGEGILLAVGAGLPLGLDVARILAAGKMP